MTFFVTDEFRKTFHYEMPEELMEDLDKALAAGVSEDACVMALYFVANDIEAGHAERGKSVETLIIERLRRMYRGGIR